MSLRSRSRASTRACKYATLSAWEWLAALWPAAAALNGRARDVTRLGVDGDDVLSDGADISFMASAGGESRAPGGAAWARRLTDVTDDVSDLDNTDVEII